MTVNVTSRILTADVQVAEIRRILEPATQVLVASHIDPDGDALGTQLAMGEYLADCGKNVYMTRDSEIPYKYRFLAGIQRIQPTSELQLTGPFDAAVILECPTPERIGGAAALLTSAVPVINIDHHRDNRHFGTVNWINPQASAVGEMVYEYFTAVGYAVSAASAEQLYTAILTDTGRFRYQSTSPRTLQIAAELVAAGADPRRICDQVYFCVRPSTMRLLGMVLNTIAFVDQGKFCLLTMTKEMLHQSGASEAETDGFVDYTLLGEGVRAGAFLKEIDDNKTKVSLRSNDGIDVGALAATLGGGGHANAAGCSVPLPVHQARDRIIQLLREAHSGA